MICYEKLGQSVTAAFESRGIEAERTTKVTWRAYLNGGEDPEIEVRLREKWLRLSMPLGGKPERSEAWRYLEANPRLPGRCKVALDRRRCEAHLREDVCVTNGTDFAEACSNAIDNVVSARRVLLKSKKRARTRAKGKSKPSEQDVDSLEDILEEAGWSFSKRESGRLVVNLELPRRGRQALVEFQNPNGCRLSVRLARFKTLSETGQHAAAVLLLMANDLVYFTRTGAERSGEGVVFFCEVRFTERPSPESLDYGLSSLSGLCHLVDKELEIFGDESVARRFLSARGLSPSRVHDSVVKESHPEPIEARR